MQNKGNSIVCRLFLVGVFLSSVSCSNIFQGASNKTSDAALLEDALKYIDDQNYEGAISKFSAMSADYKAQPEVIQSWAGAYAGKCGLDFIDYFGALGSASLTGSTLFKFFMSAWSGKVIDPGSCTLAQQKLEEISALPAGRTGGQNFFMAILGMVKIGVYLRSYADSDGTGNLGDGTPDAGVDVCINDSSNLPDDGLDEVITGLGLVTANLSYLTAVLSAGSITTALDTLNTACSVSPGACGKTDPADIVAADRDLFRDLLKTDSTNPTAPLGLGSCVDPLVAPCCP